MPSGTHPWIDDGGAPLYLVCYPTTRTDAEVLAAHAAIEAIYARVSHPVAWVVDASAVRDAPATQRKIVAEHEQRVRALARRWCAGLALVLPNAVVRGLFTAVTWISPVDYPHQTFAERGPALAWARSQLAAARSSA